MNREKEFTIKHSFLAVLVLAFLLSVVGQPMAASKPPAKMCLDMNPGLNSYLVITTKSMGSVKMMDGSTPFYSVNGVIFASPGVLQWAAPLSGSGYMYKGTDAQWFHFSASGFLVGPYGFDNVSVEVLWDVVNNTGTLNYMSPATSYKSTITPVLTDCATLGIPAKP